MSIRLDVRVDTATARLNAAARATQACETLPPESAKTLVARCRGARLFMEARQIPLAMGALDDVEKLMVGVDDKALAEAFSALVTEIRKAVQWSEGGAT